MSALGRKIPPNFNHVEKWPVKTVTPKTVQTVNKILRLPNWHWTHDQGQEGSCVGHGTGMERAITNTTQNFLLNVLGVKTRRYDTIWIWNRAKAVDPWPDTNPGDDNGTSVHAAYDVMRLEGPVRVKSMHIVNDKPVPIKADSSPTFKDGALVNRWATSVDEMRTCLSQGLPVTIGINWYENFDNPTPIGGQRRADFTIGKGNLGQIRGGHCVCIYGASDTRQAFRVKNSWGRSYPLVWLPYTTMQRLLNEDGEATVVVDR